MGDEMLTRVCELAFEVAKEGGAPSAMKNYLYLAQRPPRAYSVAQRALEEDASFRERVAARASIENVGEAGYRWLNRPEGSSQRASVPDVDASAPAASSVPPVGAPPMPAPPMSAQPTDIPPMPEPPKTEPVEVPPVAAQPAVDTVAPAPRPVPAPRTAASSPTTSSTVSSIEDELSNLRSLVDRLADERQNVRSSVSELEAELETRRSENLEMSTKLATLRQELTTVQSTESTILLERDRALARIVELESDVARLTTEVERLAAEAEGSSAEHEAALTDLAALSSERQDLRSELDTVTSERAQARSELEALTAERDQLSQAAIERDRVQGELDAVTTDRNTLSQQFHELQGERDGLVEQLAEVTGERDTLAATMPELEQLRNDNRDLAARLSVAEQARVDLEGQLEEVSENWQGAVRQLAVFEGVNGQLDDVVADRNALQAQLQQANDALAELHSRIGTSHDQIRSELSTIEAAFGAAPTTDTDRDDAEADSLVADASTASNTDDDNTDDDNATSLGAWASLEIDDAEPEVPPTDVPSTDVPSTGLTSTDAIAEIDVPAFEESVEFDRSVESPEIDASGPFSGLDTDAPIDGLTSDAEVSTDELGTDEFSTDEFSSGQFSTDEFSTDEFGSDEFDGVGIELDPSTLGGRTIGDMFGGDDRAGLEPTNDSLAPDTELPDEMFEAVPAVEDFTIEETVPGTDDLTEALPAAEPAVDETEALSAAAAGRRRLSIPAGLDDASVARLVVGTPDVMVLIDGDGVAGLGWPHLDVATRRAALVGYLGSLTETTGAAADVVFERPTGAEDALPVARAVRVRIADEAVADSAMLGSIVAGYPEQWPVAIVTDAASLRKQADDLSVTVLSNDQLLDLFLDLNSQG